MDENYSQIVTLRIRIFKNIKLLHKNKTGTGISCLDDKYNVDVQLLYITD